MKMIKYLILLTLVTKAVQGLVTDCDESYTEEEMAELFVIPKFNIYAFLIFAPIGIICTLSIIITFFLYPKIRKMPGEIILCIAISEFVLCSHWFISSIYELIQGQGPINSGIFCQVNSMFSLMAATGDFIYNIAFCLYIRITLSAVLKINSKIRIIFHSLSLAICIFIPVSAKMSNTNGLNLCGTCSVQESKTYPYEGGIIILGYTALAIYTIVFFNKTIPNNPDFLIEKKNFTSFYVIYILASCIIWTVLDISQIMISVNCYHIHSSKLNIFITFSNLSKLASPIVLSIIRFQDPTLRKKISKLFNKRMIAKSKIQGFSTDENWLAQLATNLKYTYVNTVLHGIRQASKLGTTPSIIINEKDDDSSKMSEFDQSEALISNFGSELLQSNEILAFSGQQMTRSLQKKEAIEYLSKEFGLTEPELLSKVTVSIEGSNEQNLLPMRMTIHSPKFFSLLQQKDSSMVDPFHSLDPVDNIEQIKKFKGPDGGKSGEFFFFSNDNKLIIKTLSDQELKAFKERIHYYAYHILSNEDSMISLIYGLFTFQRSDVSQYSSKFQIVIYPKSHVLIMRNISQIDRSYILRTFDMKGSEFDREALKKKSSNQNLQAITLKDTDFFKLESKIHIDHEMASKIKNILINDVKFFKMVRLMDYSLLVMKIYWKKYMQDQKISEFTEVTNFCIFFQISKHFGKDIYIIPSNQEEGIYYHIAIIDYLQEWNAQKMAEQKGKKIIHRNINLDTSAQNPQVYGDRFIEKLLDKILTNKQDL